MFSAQARRWRSRRWIVPIFGIFMVAALAWAADEPWKDKQYQQWDAKDLDKIMSNSPWAHVIRIDAPWKKAGAAAPSTGTASPDVPQQNSGQTPGTTTPTNRPMGGSSSQNPNGNSGGYGQSGGGGGYGQPDAGMQQTPTAPFVIRWSSSRVMREAFVRDAVLNGKLPAADADAAVAKPVDVYQIVVAGTDMTPFSNMDDNALKSAASLTLKHSKKQIPANAVTIQRTSDGKGIGVIIFSFPKKLDSGEPAIAADEKSVEFRYIQGKVTIKAAFEFSKMVDSQGTDL